ncbi:MAG: asparagine synthase (glutamine-hydrolyzing) [Sphingomonadaceae bacterium]
MCGIAGIMPGNGMDPVSVQLFAKRALAALAHRGPDGHGSWQDRATGTTLLHTRLAILDLTPGGAQPMASKDGRWHVAFNGEIYNFEQLRKALDGESETIRWASDSDTEVLVEAIARRGFLSAVKTCNGMFAVAAWDSVEQTLWLARDRAGEKPLYWGWMGTTFLFGSELRALAAVPGFAAEIDPDAVGHMLAFGYVPGPRSILRGFGKLPAGSFLRVRAGDAPGAERLGQYWEAPRPTPSPAALPDSAFEDLLFDAVAMRMRSDVPLGAFLSGGIDSSLVVAMMQRQASRPVNSFAIGFSDPTLDEATHAAEVAKVLGTHHHLLIATPRDALSVVPVLADIWDEPFADSSQIPTALLARLARPHVTVALSGDGGDELFGGYARYIAFGPLWRRLRLVPRWLRLPAVRLATSVARILPPNKKGLRALMSAGRLQRIVHSLGAADAHDFYARLLMLRPSAGRATSPSILLDQYDIGRDFADPVLGMGFVDFGMYLPDDVLVKVDRATMAVALEARAPFLDHRVIEAASALPMERRVAGGRGKIVLRNLLAHLCPGVDFDRQKQGFTPPLGAWLRADLRDWAEALLRNRTGSVAPFIDWSAVDREWRSHLDGAQDTSAALWPVLMLLAWNERWRFA